ncbi:MAG: hypothetical protein U0Z53_02395 [Blastocatellia bacterium]
MKSGLSIILILLSCTILVSARDANCPVFTYQDSQPLKFEMAICGVGIFHSSQLYKVSDGTTLTVESSTFKTVRLAQKALKKKLKAIEKIIQKDDVLDDFGSKIGERVTGLLASEGGKKKTILLSLEGRFLYIIEAASLRHIQEFQKQN